MPIIFASAGDPVTSGLVARLDRPGGNITGFGSLEAMLGGKWLELLSEIAKKVALSERAQFNAFGQIDFRPIKDVQVRARLVF